MMQEWLLGVGSVLLEVIVAFQGRRPAWRSPLDVSTVLFVPLSIVHYHSSRMKERGFGRGFGVQD